MKTSLRKKIIAKDIASGAESVKENQNENTYAEQSLNMKSNNENKNITSIENVELSKNNRFEKDKNCISEEYNKFKIKSNMLVEEERNTNLNKDISELAKENINIKINKNKIQEKEVKVKSIKSHVAERSIDDNESINRSNVEKEEIVYNSNVRVIKSNVQKNQDYDNSLNINKKTIEDIYYSQKVDKNNIENTYNSYDDVKSIKEDFINQKTLNNSSIINSNMLLNKNNYIDIKSQVSINKNTINEEDNYQKVRSNYNNEKHVITSNRNHNDEHKNNIIINKKIGLTVDNRRINKTTNRDDREIVENELNQLETINYKSTVIKKEILKNEESYFVNEIMNSYENNVYVEENENKKNNINLTNYKYNLNSLVSEDVKNKFNKNENQKLYEEKNENLESFENYREKNSYKIISNEKDNNNNNYDTNKEIKPNIYKNNFENHNPPYRKKIKDEENALTNKSRISEDNNNPKSKHNFSVEDTTQDKIYNEKNPKNKNLIDDIPIKNVFFSKEIPNKNNQKILEEENPKNILFSDDKTTKNKKKPTYEEENFINENEKLNNKFQGKKKEIPNQNNANNLYEPFDEEEVQRNNNKISNTEEQLKMKNSNPDDEKLKINKNNYDEKKPKENFLEKQKPKQKINEIEKDNPNNIYKPNEEEKQKNKTKIPKKENLKNNDIDEEQPKIYYNFPEKDFNKIGIPKNRNLNINKSQRMPDSPHEEDFEENDNDENEKIKSNKKRYTPKEEDSEENEIDGYEKTKPDQKNYSPMEEDSEYEYSNKEKYVKPGKKYNQTQEEKSQINPKDFVEIESFDQENNSQQNDEDSKKENPYKISTNQKRPNLKKPIQEEKFEPKNKIDAPENRKSKVKNKNNGPTENFSGGDDDKKENPNKNKKKFIEKEKKPKIENPSPGNKKGIRNDDEKKKKLKKFDTSPEEYISKNNITEKEAKLKNEISEDEEDLNQDNFKEIDPKKINKYSKNKEPKNENTFQIDNKPISKNNISEKENKNKPNNKFKLTVDDDPNFKINIPKNQEKPDDENSLNEEDKKPLDNYSTPLDNITNKSRHPDNRRENLNKYPNKAINYEKNENPLKDNIEPKKIKNITDDEDQENNNNIKKIPEVKPKNNISYEVTDAKYQKKLPYEEENWEIDNSPDDIEETEIKNPDLNKYVHKNPRNHNDGLKNLNKNSDDDMDSQILKSQSPKDSRKSHNKIEEYFKPINEKKLPKYEEDNKLNKKNKLLPEDEKHKQGKNNNQPEHEHENKNYKNKLPHKVGELKPKNKSECEEDNKPIKTSLKLEDEKYKKPKNKINSPESEEDEKPNKTPLILDDEDEYKPKNKNNFLAESEDEIGNKNKGNIKKPEHFNGKNQTNFKPKDKNKSIEEIEDKDNKLPFNEKDMNSNNINSFPSNENPKNKNKLLQEDKENKTPKNIKKLPEETENILKTADKNKFPEYSEDEEDKIPIYHTTFPKNIKLKNKNILPLDNLPIEDDVNAENNSKKIPNLNKQKNINNLSDGDKNPKKKTNDKNDTKSKNVIPLDNKHENNYTPSEFIKPHNKKNRNPNEEDNKYYKIDELPKPINKTNLNSKEKDIPPFKEKTPEEKEDAQLMNDFPEEESYKDKNKIPVKEKPKNKNSNTNQIYPEGIISNEDEKKNYPPKKEKPKINIPDSETVDSIKKPKVSQDEIKYSDDDYDERKPKNHSETPEENFIDNHPSKKKNPHLNDYNDPAAKFSDPIKQNKKYPKTPYKNQESFELSDDSNHDSQNHESSLNSPFTYENPKMKEKKPKTVYEDKQIQVEMDDPKSPQKIYIPPKIKDNLQKSLINNEIDNNQDLEKKNPPIEKYNDFPLDSTFNNEDEDDRIINEIIMKAQSEKPLNDKKPTDIKKLETKNIKDPLDHSNNSKEKNPKYFPTNENPLTINEINPPNDSTTKKHVGFIGVTALICYKDKDIIKNLYIQKGNGPDLRFEKFSSPFNFKDYLKTLKKPVPKKPALLKKSKDDKSLALEKLNDLINECESTELGKKKRPVYIPKDPPTEISNILIT
jgi:hypothetical protein